MEKSKKIIWIFLLLITFFVPLAIYRGTYNFILIKLSFTQILILLSLILWLGGSLSSWKTGVGFTCARKGIQTAGLGLRRTPLSSPLALFFFLSLLSLLGSNYRWAGSPAIYSLITCLLLYVLTVNVVRDRRSLRGLVFVWLLSTGLVSFYGLYQHFFAGITPPRSTFGNANFFAAYLVLVFPLALALFINSIFSGLRKNWGKILSLALLLLAITLSLFFARARGAWLGLAVGLILLSWLACLQKRRWIAKRLIPAFLVLSFILAASLAPWLLKQEFIREDLEKGTAGIRMLIWEGTVRMIAAHPFLGSGIGSFQVAYPKYRLPEYFRNPRAVDATAHAHNEFLQVAAETGILGLGAFLWIFIVFFKKGIYLVRKEEDRDKRVLMLGLISGVAGLLAANLVGVNLRFPASAIFLWLAMGLVMSQSNRAPGHQNARATEQQSTRAPERQGNRATGHQGTRAAGQQSAVGSRQLLGHCFLSPVLRQIILGLVLLLAGWIGWQVVAKPFLAERYFQQGINYRKAGDWERAISKYRKAIELNPYFLEVHFRLGFAYASVGDLDKAIAAYLRVMDLAPDFSRIQANIAFLYKKRGELDKAIRAYQRALELNPYDTKSIHFLKEIHEKRSSVNFSKNVDIGCGL